jgi:hypothetical protein
MNRTSTGKECCWLGSSSRMRVEFCVTGGSSRMVITRTDEGIAVVVHIKGEAVQVRGGREDNGVASVTRGQRHIWREKRCIASLEEKHK